MNKPVILFHNWQKICDRARISPIFIKYVCVKDKKAEWNINKSSFRHFSVKVFSSAVPSGSGAFKLVPSGSGAFQMPTCMSASSTAVAASTLRGEGPISETLQLFLFLAPLCHLAAELFKCLWRRDRLALQSVGLCSVCRPKSSTVGSMLITWWFCGVQGLAQQVAASPWYQPSEDQWRITVCRYYCRQRVHSDHENLHGWQRPSPWTDLQRRRHCPLPGGGHDGEWSPMSLGGLRVTNPNIRLACPSVRPSVCLSVCPSTFRL